MKILDFINSYLNPKKYGSSKTVSSGTIAAEIFFKELALYTAISYIANAISKCEIKTYKEGKEVKDRPYYIFNVSPNENQNASQFWHEVIEKMFYEGESLCITSNDRIYCADGYGVDEYPILGNKYSGVTIGNLQLDKNYKADEVYIFRLDNKEVKNLIDGINASYSKLLGYAMDNYRKSNSSKYKLKMPMQKAGDEEFNNAYEEIIEEQLKDFIESIDAVYPEFEGYTLEDISPKTNVKDSSDITNLRKDIFEMVSQALNIPLSLMLGNITNMGEVVKTFITFAVDPFANMISEELTRKQGNEYEKSYDNWKNGTYCKVDTSTINHIDILDVAEKVDKLISSGTLCIDEVREKIDMDPLNTDFSKTHFITKNYDTADNTLKGGESNE